MDQPHQQELAARMKRPQRHRLLQGFPPVPLMQMATKSESPFAVRRADGAIVNSPYPQSRFDEPKPKPEDLAEPFLELDKTRRLIIGIIPHTQCIPRHPACGFCTFPHDPQNKRQRERVVRSVSHDIRFLTAAHKDQFYGRRVDAIYFGGGTANLATPAEIHNLFNTLEAMFYVSDAEVTLEGIPSLFASWFHEHLRSLAKLPARQKRISMGIQTFDRTQLWRMGRDSFGDEKTIKEIVRHAHDLGLTTSGDLLFALPGQTLEEMREDVDSALACGLDQICLYQLVLYAGLGTPWSEDPNLVAQMKEPAVLVDYWLDLRERLLRNGYVQTTLTNFERADVNQSDRRFVYERAGFNPESYDALGFGPLSISTFLNFKQQRGVKLLRRKRVRSLPWSGDDLYFGYGPEDLKLLWITRRLAGLSIDRTRYRNNFGEDITEHFAAALKATVEAGLLELSDQKITLTPRGMFYSDAIVGTFAAERATKLRTQAAGLNTMTILKEPINLHSEIYSGMG
jgi:oxygen-independent coproporphyrinogen-3 oxidase